MFFSLRSRLIVLITLLLTVQLATIVIVINQEAKQTIGASIEQSVEQTMIQYTSYVQSITTQIDDVAHQILSNDVTQEWVNTRMNNALPQGEKLLMDAEMKRYISSVALNHSVIVSISIYDDKGSVLGIGDHTYMEKDYFRSDWYRNAEDNQGWSISHLDPLQPRYLQNEPVNSYVFPLVNLQTFTRIGVIKINFKTSLLEQPLQKIAIGDKGMAFLMNRKGEQLFMHKDETLISEISKKIASNLDRTATTSNQVMRDTIYEMGDGKTLFYLPLDQTNWVLVSAVSDKDLFERLTRLQWFLFLLVAVLLVVFIALASWLASGIARPLSRLAAAMKYVESGDFDAVHFALSKVKRSRSEIGYVTNVFDRMQRRIKHLIKTEYQANLHRRDAQYKALLMQINPHFLYNTLEVISSLAAQGEKDRVIDVTESLGSMLRSSLKLNSELITLKDELEQAKHYLNIISIRFGDRITLELDEDRAVLDGKTIKFILQPLIENAMKYTMDYKETGRIFLSIGKRESKIKISIEDNGIGMSSETIQSILYDNEMKESPDLLSSVGKRIGLGNVLARCRLYYGETFEVDIQSTPNLGTSISLYFPYVTKDDSNV